jgi:signal transduction histidine kinase
MRLKATRERRRRRRQAVLTAARIPGAAALGRRPVRLRLTLIYSGLFLLAGAGLLGATYALVASLPATKGVYAESVTPKASGSAAPVTVASQIAASCRKSYLLPAQVAKCKASAETAFDKGTQTGASAAHRSALDYLMYTSLAALGLTALLSGLIGWLVAGRALRPVHAITAAARRASEENLGERIALAGPPDELKDLADTFDAMLARLDAAFASQRRFVANASHELRTPLTVMRTAIDVTLAKPERTPAQLEEMAVEVRQAADRAESLIEALLTLARSDRGTGPRVPLDLAILAEDALEDARPAIQAASLQINASLGASPATGDPVLVARLVANLVDNAVRYNVPDGWVEVVTGTRDGTAFISVTNSGWAISPADADTLFEPFRRHGPGAGSPPTADGTGLGLSIVRSVVTAHRGEVTARPRVAGGLEVVVALPTALPGQGKR